uniref:Uncharacterized protein n=1 Tax=Octactis speculum TaxID=3111310 RepID=A0A7S2DLR1_9STRA|mmetsp:Transcript_51013/g.69477  ORF Transcript_51013/g.69477 Transcript_51013/m.69477 type:complete len:101 (+) Transcript_51013:208-510(+)
MEGSENQSSRMNIADLLKVPDAVDDDHHADDHHADDGSGTGGVEIEDSLRTEELSAAEMLKALDEIDALQNSGERQSGPTLRTIETDGTGFYDSESFDSS